MPKNNDLSNTFQFRITDGQINLGSEYNKARLNERKKKGGRGRIIFELPESRDQRKFFEGAVIPLATYFQENLDHHNWEDCEVMRNSLIEDCLGVNVKIVMGKERKERKSSRGNEMLNKVCEYTIDYLVSEYAINPEEVLNPDKYETWRDEIFPFGGPDNYIDFMLESKVLKAK